MLRQSGELVHMHVIDGIIILFIDDINEVSHPLTGQPVTVIYNKFVQLCPQYKQLCMKLQNYSHE